MNRLTEEEASVLNALKWVFTIVGLTIVISMLLMLAVKLGWSTPAFAQAEVQANAKVFLPVVVLSNSGSGPEISDAGGKKPHPGQNPITLAAENFDNTTFLFAPSVRPEFFVNCIDNRYFPLPVGQVWKYEGETAEGTESSVVTVTNQTKVILGVTTRVVRDTVLLDGVLLEDTFDWYAQDVRGHVWYFGEEVSNYENEQLANNEGSWEAGVNGAIPGIIMLNQPLPGDIYRQEYWVGEAEDMAGVLSLTESVSVPYGTFNRVLETADYNPLDGDLEHKYYARNVGLIREENVETGESAELISVSHSRSTPEKENDCDEENDQD